MKILVLNGGSSNLKCWYHDMDGSGEPPAHPVWKAIIEWDAISNVGEVLRAVPGKVELVSHRIVHGGDLRRTAWLTPEVRAAIAANAPAAPEHSRRELELIAAVDRIFGAAVGQAAVFDTSFHATIPPPAYTYPGPYEWLDQGIRRYGFHGISHGYAARTAAQRLGGNSGALRLITCHLGSGASLAAVRGGECVDTTMGFTPLEGLMMGSRSGTIDPGIMIHLMRKGYTADQLDDVLNRRSGLLGISGISSDMREILAAKSRGSARAELAFEIYTHRLTREIGSLLAVLGGADAFVFTGGVGENCAPLREAVARRFEFLKNLRILVIHAEEEWEMARQCLALTGGAG
jgi:acetate kinase